MRMEKTTPQDPTVNNHPGHPHIDWGKILPHLFKGFHPDVRRFFYEDEKLDFENKRSLERFASGFDVNRWC